MYRQEYSFHVYKNLLVFIIWMPSLYVMTLKMKVQIIWFPSHIIKKYQWASIKRIIGLVKLNWNPFQWIQILCKYFMLTKRQICCRRIISHVDIPWIQFLSLLFPISAANIFIPSFRLSLSYTSRNIWCKQNDIVAKLVRNIPHF